MKPTLLVAFGAALLAGAAAPMTDVVAATATYFRQTTTSTPLPTTGGTLTKVLSIGVPAGSWIVAGKAEVVDFDAHDLARCFLLLNNVEVDMSASEIGGGDNFPLVAVLP